MRIQMKIQSYMFDSHPLFQIHTHQHRLKQHSEQQRPFHQPATTPSLAFGINAAHPW